MFTSPLSSARVLILCSVGFHSSTRRWVRQCVSVNLLSVHNTRHAVETANWRKTNNYQDKLMISGLCDTMPSRLCCRFWCVTLSCTHRVQCDWLGESHRASCHRDVHLWQRHLVLILHQQVHGHYWPYTKQPHLSHGHGSALSPMMFFRAISLITHSPFWRQRLQHHVPGILWQHGC